MKISKDNVIGSKKPIWLFADKLGDETTPILLEFVEDKEELAKDKKTMVPILCFLGSTEGFCGDVYLSLWKTKISPKIIEIFGDDTEKWKGQRFFAYTTDKKIINLEFFGGN